MPTAYLKKLNETTGIALDKLEEYWGRAKKLAKKNKDAVGENYWRYTMGIMKNMVGVSESKDHANFPQWWRDMDREARKKYLTEHPKSRFAKRLRKLEKSGTVKKQKAAHKKRQAELEETFKNVESPVKLPDPEPEPEPVGNDGPDDDFADQVDPDEVEKDVEPQPEFEGNDDPDPNFADQVDPDEVEQEKPKPAPRKKTTHSLKSVASRLWKRVRQRTLGTLRHHKQGFHAIERFLTGGELSEVEMARAKRTAGLAAKLVLGSLIGLALFTPLSGLAQELGSHYLNIQAGSSESSDMYSESADTEDTAAKFTDGFHAWLVEQDIPALAKQLKGMKNDD